MQVIFIDDLGSSRKTHAPHPDRHYYLDVWGHRCLLIIKLFLFMTVFLGKSSPNAFAFLHNSTKYLFGNLTKP